ncbi:TonB-dependent receptor [Massilia aquatica]|uniref:TonB-dependent siderophore receptor n=1 Tax=Massilia aquatica TaxID=2609000 RepID=A0ABX0M5I7_9BURK|nr:TonB-dependent siderophore receptor [Massilia aquatica]NHZ41544.1 TonB-dependent siderophore receptor [Massilia aquatica]
MTSTPFHAAALPFALALTCTGPARADEPLPTVEITGTAPRANGKLNLDTASATGSRLGLTPRETPASVTLVERATIDARGAQDTQEILRAIPGVTAHNAPGNIGVSYRGFGSGSVSQLFNGINVQYAIAARPVDSWIYERVEAIGGPSSFLFGAGAVGGSINYITRVAERRNAGQAQLRLGTNGLKEASVGLNRQIGGAADAGHYLRIDLNHRDADSWIDGAGARSTQLAASLLSGLGPRVTHTLAYELQDEDVARPYWGTPLLNPVAGRARIDPATRFKNYNSADGVYAQRVHWLRSVTEWRASAQLELTNTAYAYDAVRDYRNVETYRFNPANTAVARSGILLQHHQQRMLGNRLDATYKGTLAGRRSDWALGIDVSVNKQTRFPTSLASTLGEVDPYDVATERFFDIPGMSPVLRPDRDNKVSTRAAYLENRTAVAPSLHLVTALRHERIALGLVNRREISAASPASFARRYRPTTGRAGLVWDLAPAASAYIQYATAADPPSGVLSTASFADVRNNSELTTGRQGEIGAKLDFWQGKGSATVAAYRIERKNIASQDPDNSALTVLVGEQSAKGVELALGLQPTRQWSVQANLTRVDAQYEHYRQGAVSLAGKTPANTPRSVANLWLGYAVTPGIKASVGLRRVGSVYADAANSIGWPAYTLLDLGLSYQLSGDVALVGRVRNAGDRVHAVNLGASMAYLGAPRTADLALRVAF